MYVSGGQKLCSAVHASFCGALTGFNQVVFEKHAHAPYGVRVLTIRRIQRAHVLHGPLARHRFLLQQMLSSELTSPLVASL